MTSLFALILSLCSISPVYAADMRSWMVNGSELLRNLSANESSQNLISDPRLLNAQAQGYIVAIMDSEDWCMTGQVLPQDVYDRVFT